MVQLLLSLEEIAIKKSNDLIPFICSFCGKTSHKVKRDIKENLNKNYKNLFCSSGCHQKHHKAKSWKEVICNNCGKSFEKRTKEIKRTKLNFCCHACFIFYYNNLTTTKLNIGHCKKCDNPINPKFNYCDRCKRNNLSKEELITLIKNSRSILSVIDAIELSISGASYKFIKDFIKENNIDASHFSGKGYLKGKQHNYNNLSPEKLFVKNSHWKTTTIKNNLIKWGYKEYKCEICGITEWQNKRITLELHHIDGNRKNNSVENLLILCPNCHSQTNNFRSGTKKII